MVDPKITALAKVSAVISAYQKVFFDKLVDGGSQTARR